MTIREFLEDQLTAEELEAVDMMPRLVPNPPSIQRERFEARQRHMASASAAASATQRQASLPITLRFMRPELHSAHDDIVNIFRIGQDAFKITFRDGDGKHKSRARNLTRTEVLEYLSNTLRLIAIDEEPFANVQLLAPNMPTVVIKPKNMTSQTRDLIYDTVTTTMNNWPVSI
jgi:exo-beta-1,3-glucanase (GH17 family)